MVTWNILFFSISKGAKNFFSKKKAFSLESPEIGHLTSAVPFPKLEAAYTHSGLGPRTDDYRVSRLALLFLAGLSHASDMARGYAGICFHLAGPLLAELSLQAPKEKRKTG